MKEKEAEIWLTVIIHTGPEGETYGMDAEEKGADMSVKATNEALEQVDNKVRWYLQSDAEKYEKQLAEKLAEKEKQHQKELADKDRELVERDRENAALRQENEELKKLLSQQPMWINENDSKSK